MILKLLGNGALHKSHKLCLYSTSTEKTPLHGSYHWLAERSLSLATLSLIVLSPLSSLTPLLNLGLSITLPLHSHFGFSAIITDYLPQRKYPISHPLARGALWTTTGLCMYGLWLFNTKDIGIIEGIKNVWTAKQFMGRGEGEDCDLTFYCDY